MSTTEAIAERSAQMNSELSERNLTSGELRLQKSAPRKTITPPGTSRRLLFKPCKVGTLLIRKAAPTRETAGLPNLSRMNYSTEAGFVKAGMEITGDKTKPPLDL
ncbi:MAG: hypothetical protein LUE15_05200 [Oscillospiraceae bacterium]|nr:hypothetical protein [Oscillospiraceae bacterium]